MRQRPRLWCMLFILVPAMLASMVGLSAERDGQTSKPIVVAAPGVLQLDGNLFATEAPGIIVRSCGVTIDLNGYAIVCEDQAGIVIEDGVAGITITNGTIISPTVGIDGPQADMVSVRRIAIDRPLREGIRLGVGGVVEHVRVWRAAGDGMVLGARARVSNSTAIACAGDGIRTGAGAVVDGVSAANNGGLGIRIGRGSTLTDSSAVSNANGGVRASYACVLARVAADSNGMHGIVVDDGSIITGCVCGDNAGDGVRAGSGVAIASLAVRTNSGRGLVMEADGSAEGVVSTNNGMRDRWSQAGAVDGL
ncbi:MAG: hypothetical protein RIB58_11365 [Phycisphaerales bacterium]